MGKNMFQGREFDPGKRDFSTKKKQKQKKCPTGGERLNRSYTEEFDFTVDEGKEWLNPSREKN